MSDNKIFGRMGTLQFTRSPNQLKVIYEENEEYKVTLKQSELEGIKRTLHRRLMRANGATATILFDTKRLIVLTSVDYGDGNISFIDVGVEGVERIS